MSLKNSAFLFDIDKLFSFLGLIISILVIAWSWSNNTIGGILAGILILFSCLFWLLIRRTDKFNFEFPSIQTGFKIFSISFFILYGLSIFTVYNRPNLYERPLLYFFLIALMAGSIACEILAAKRRYSSFILFQVILLGFIITWSQLIITPGLVGIDPWYHLGLTNRIIDSSFLPLDYFYSKLPFFHLTIAMTSIFTTLPYKLANLVSVSLGQIICNAIFIFLIANYLFKNHRIGLLASVLVIIANLHILMAYWSIPNSFGAIFITIVLYLIFVKLKDAPRLYGSVLILLILPAIILTHSIVALSMAILLFAIWIAFNFSKLLYPKNENRITLAIPICFTVGMLAWWAYTTTNLFTIAKFIEFDFSLYNGGSNLPLGVIPPLEIITSVFGLYLFFAFSVIGILYMISQKGNRLSFSFALVASIPLIISFISNFTQSEIISYRWFYLAQILLSIPLSVGLLLIGIRNFKKTYCLYCFIGGFVIILALFMILSPWGNNDNHTLTPTLGTSNYFTESELIGTDFFAKKTIGIISSDSNYAYNPSSSLFEQVYGINRNRLKNLDPEIGSAEFSRDGSIKILRSRQIEELRRRKLLSSKINPDINNYLTNNGFNKIYDNKVMTGYTDNFNPLTVI